MALQGTIDTFGFTEVVRLLAAGSKTGALRLEGTRGSGSLWVSDGKVVGITVDHAPLATDPAEALFELLRFDDGSFTFEPGEEPAEASEATDVEEILVDAEATLAEWREIEKVVPTTHANLSLRAELSKADVVLDKQRWRLVAAIGGGVTVATVGETLGLGELPVSRAVKELIELGVVDLEIGEPEPEPVVAPEPELVIQPEPEVLAAEPVDMGQFALGGDDDPLADLTAEPSSARAQLDEFAAGFGLSDAEPGVEPVVLADIPLPARDGMSDFGVDTGQGGPFSAGNDASPAIDPLGSGELSGFATPLPPDDGQYLAGGGDAAEVARQLSNLSPAAARAVAAAAKATTDEEREAALAAVSQDGEEPIDRELLLRFLASVKS